MWLDGIAVALAFAALSALALDVLLTDSRAPFVLLLSYPLADLVFTAVVGAVVVRTALTFKEVALLADARRATRTDELTGLANRVTPAHARGAQNP